jgi:hypothetical protein
MYLYIINYVNSSPQQDAFWYSRNRVADEKWRDIPRHHLTDRTAVLAKSTQSYLIHFISAIGSALPGCAKPCQAPNLGMCTAFVMIQAVVRGSAFLA